MSVMHPVSVRSGPDASALRGVIFIHSCPRSLIPHVEWALANLLGTSFHLNWSAQSVLPGTHRADSNFKAPAGMAGQIASELRAFPGLRFEVTQDPSAHTEGERYACTPSLGIFRGAMGAHGDVVVNEEQLRSAMLRASGGADLAAEIRTLIGTAWDEELEVFRYAGDGAPVRWMHEVG